MKNPLETLSEPLIGCVQHDCDKCKAMAQELEAAKALNSEWEKKAATWLASPEAAQRLDGYRDLAQQLNKATEELEVAKADAARYRWFREKAPTMYFDTRSKIIHFYEMNNTLGWNPQEIDAAIDAAAGAAQKEQQT